MKYWEISISYANYIAYIFECIMLICLIVSWTKWNCLSSVQRTWNTLILFIFRNSNWICLFHFEQIRGTFNKFFSLLPTCLPVDVWLPMQLENCYPIHFSFVTWLFSITQLMFGLDTLKWLKNSILVNDRQ